MNISNKYLILLFSRPRKIILTEIKKNLPKNKMGWLKTLNELFSSSSISLDWKGLQCKKKREKPFDSFTD